VAPSNLPLKLPAASFSLSGRLRPDITRGTISRGRSLAASRRYATVRDHEQRRREGARGQEFGSGYVALSP
jgi:hypothetical protein